MDKFINNVKTFMSVNHLKKNFLTKRTSIGEAKIYNIFGPNERGRLSYNEMKEIAEAFGREIEYFTREDFVAEDLSVNNSLQVSYFTGEVSDKDKAVLEKLIKIAMLYDGVVSRA